MTHKTKAFKAQSATVVGPTVSICNAEGVRFMGSPCGPVPGSPQGVVARSLCARGTRPHARLALRAARPGREPSDSVSRPW